MRKCNYYLSDRVIVIQIAMIKIAAPRMLCKVADQAIQIYGGAGVCQDFPLAQM